MHGARAVCRSRSGLIRTDFNYKGLLRTPPGHRTTVRDQTKDPRKLVLKSNTLCRVEAPLEQPGGGRGGEGLEEDVLPHWEPVELLEDGGDVGGGVLVKIPELWGGRIDSYRRGHRR